MNHPVYLKKITLKEYTRAVVRPTLVTMCVLLGVFFSAAFGVLLYIADDLNLKASQQSRLILKKALLNRQKEIRNHLKDYAVWGEAYSNLSPRVNTEWAWDNQNLGTSLYSVFGYEGVFVVTGDGVTAYSVVNGRYSPPSLPAWLGSDPLPGLRHSLSLSEGRAISGLVVTAGKLTILSAAWITPEEGKANSAGNSRPSLMIFADQLTPGELNDMGQEYGIKQVRLEGNTPEFIPEDGSTLVVSGSGGSVRLRWAGEDPGGALLTGMLPLLFLSMLAAGIISVSLIQSAARRARMNDENTFLLEQSRLALLSSERRFRDVAETTTDWIWETDDQLRLTWISGRFTAVTGHQVSDWAGRSLAEFLLDDSHVLSLLKQSLRKKENLTLSACRYLTVHGEQRFCRMTVKRYSISTGRSGVRGTATDVTSELETQVRIRYLSYHDDLTGLPNRARLKEFLTEQLQNPPDTENPLALMMVDLDNFKPVNDIYGHTAGDRVLHETASRLSDCLKSTGLVTRHGGDEFIIVISETGGKESVENLCSAIIREVSQPFYINGNAVRIGASMGIALAPQDAQDMAGLLRFADIALYATKNAGRNGWMFYQREMGEKIAQRQEMENELRKAIHEEQLRLVYQPRYDIKTSRVTSLEALVRWEHPRQGQIMPDRFIPVAEEAGFISELSDWVMLTACRDVHDLFPGLSVSVNISAVEFKDGALYGRVQRALKLSGLESTRMEIEVTENAMLLNPEKTIQIMNEIRVLGVKFLIDDFGTGYASLGQLRRFPFDGIKLDRSFIMPIETCPDARDIVASLINLGKACSLDITAEGVESKGQMDLLSQMKCDVLQGYYIGRPMPPEQLKKVMPELPGVQDVL